MKVLIVDDEKNIRESLKKYIGLEGGEADGVETGERALEALQNERYDAVILDLKLPGMTGQAVLEAMQQRGILSPVIMISAHGQISDAVDALKSGAKDYLVKPFDPAELVIKLRALIDNTRRELKAEAEKRTAQAAALTLGQSSVMREISERIDKIARTGATVLITGESGTGKEVAAREIHARSPFCEEPFAAVNIGGIHEGLMESELFGHEKGAFTGAVSRKNGLFELAGRGTIFLDEIGEMPLPLQVKLLRVLQERKVRRLGGTSDIPVNARIISATNRDLEEMVKDGRFREDLYYRLNVARINLPPLRERAGDIPLLSERLLLSLSARIGRSAPALLPCALSCLSTYPFPGNIRELENILERALIYAEGNVITAEDLGLRDNAAPKSAVFETASTEAVEPHLAIKTIGTMETIEKQAVLDALSRFNGNRTKAASALGISRKTILNKMKSYGID